MLRLLHVSLAQQLFKHVLVEGMQLAEVKKLVAKSPSNVSMMLNSGSKQHIHTGGWTWRLFVSAISAFKLRPGHIARGSPIRPSVASHSSV